eukprot:9363531-Prorocentrum_lima.AAC.1
MCIRDSLFHAHIPVPAANSAVPCWQLRMQHCGVVGSLHSPSPLEAMSSPRTGVHVGHLQGR